MRTYHSTHTTIRYQSSHGRLFVLLAAIVVVELLTRASLVQAQYSFVRIDVPGSLPNLGEVSFTGFGPFGPGGTSAGVYKGSGGPLTTIADTSGPFTSLPNSPFINCAGEVGFRGIAGINGAYRGNGGPLTTIHSATNGVDPSAIDDDGTIVLVDNAVGIMTGSGGPTTVVVPLGGNFGGFGLPDINAGTVAFHVALTNGGTAIYTANAAGVLSPPIAVSGGLVAAVQGPRINQLGNLVWQTNLTNGDQEITTNIGGVTTTFADTTGPYAQFGFHYASDINYYNDIAFSATLDSTGGAIGIYMGPNPNTDRVIGPGDSLAGKIVRDAYFGGLNDRGQISFGVIFDDFTFGIFRADPAVLHADVVCVPEPSTASLTLFGILIMARAVAPSRRASQIPRNSVTRYMSNG